MYAWLNQIVNPHTPKEALLTLILTFLACMPATFVVAAGVVYLQMIFHRSYRARMTPNSISVEVSRSSSVWFLTLDACKKPLSMPIID
jgi:hypothetical protein